MSEPTERIPRDVLARLIEQSRPRRPPAVVRRIPPPPDDDFADEEAPSGLVTPGQHEAPRIERLPGATQRSRISEILAASSRVAGRSGFAHLVTRRSREARVLRARTPAGRPTTPDAWRAS